VLPPVREADRHGSALPASADRTRRQSISNFRENSLVAARQEAVWTIADLPSSIQESAM
jgi:hypothetical protein